MVLGRNFDVVVKIPFPEEDDQSDPNFTIFWGTSGGDRPVAV